MILSPSILSADFANLQRDVQAVEAAGAQYLHIDVMDGHFVPNITIGAPVVKALRPVSGLVFDVHLMIENPGKYSDDFIAAGADIITFHYEAVTDSADLIRKLRASGVKASVSVKPKTPIDVVFPLLPLLDMVLVMTVEPGFGGQSFIEQTHEKIAALRREIDKRNLNCLIETDGGINKENVSRVLKSGAGVIVAGSAIFGSGDIDTAVKEFFSATL